MSAPALTNYANGGAAVTGDGLNTFLQIIIISLNNINERGVFLF